MTHLALIGHSIYALSNPSSPAFKSSQAKYRATIGGFENVWAYKSAGATPREKALLQASSKAKPNDVNMHNLSGTLYLCYPDLFTGTDAAGLKGLSTHPRANEIVNKIMAREAAVAAAILNAPKVPGPLGNTAAGSSVASTPPAAPSPNVFATPAVQPRIPVKMNKIAATKFITDELARLGGVIASIDAISSPSNDETAIKARAEDALVVMENNMRTVNALPTGGSVIM